MTRLGGSPLALTICLGSSCSLLYDSGHPAVDAVPVDAPPRDAALVDGPAPSSCWRKALALTAEQERNETLVDFPLLVHLDIDEVEALEIGGDFSALRFTDAAGDSLPFEIDHENGASGEISVWVRATIEPQDTTTHITIRGGNPDAAADNRMTEVWSNGYVGVYHLDETFTALPEEIDDSSPSSNHGSADANLGVAAGRVGGAVTLSGELAAIGVSAGC